MKKILVQFVFCFILTITVLFSVMGISCKLTPEGISILTGDYVSPKLLEYSVKDAQSMYLSFSKGVKLRDISVYQKEDNLLIFSQNITTTNSEDLTETVINFGENTECGVKYNLCATAEDLKGNSLSFQIEFNGYNSNVPLLLLSEVRTEYSKGKCEFIELYALSDGNLSGVELICANGKNPIIYEFPSVNIKEGEYIVLHGRKLEETCIDELTDDLSSCIANESVKDARDFWINNELAVIAKTDVLILKDRSGGNIIDCLLFAEENKTWKEDTDMALYAQSAFDSGLWLNSSSVEDAFCSTGVTVTRSISRVNYPTKEELINKTYVNSCVNWIVTKTSGATPGKINCKEKYIPK